VGVKKGGIKMNPRKALLVMGMVAALFMVLPAVQAMAGVEPPDPNSGEKIVGPEMWGVVVIDGTVSPIRATLRVKKVDGCNIDTDPQTAEMTSSPVTAGDVLYFRLAPGSVFGLSCQPIITKVKNFKVDDDLVSFDCQIKFIVTDDALTECPQ
jgi:hypothetical protein